MQTGRSYAWEYMRLPAMDTTATMSVATIHARSERIFRLHVLNLLEIRYAHQPRTRATSDSTINTEIRVENSTSVIVAKLKDKRLDSDRDYFVGFPESSERTRLLKSWYERIVGIRAPLRKNEGVAFTWRVVPDARSLLILSATAGSFMSFANRSISRPISAAYATNTDMSGSAFSHHFFCSAKSLSCISKNFPCRPAASTLMADVIEFLCPASGKNRVTTVRSSLNSSFNCFTRGEYAAQASHSKSRYSTNTTCPPEPPRT